MSHLTPDRTNPVAMTGFSCVSPSIFFVALICPADTLTIDPPSSVMNKKIIIAASILIVAFALLVIFRKAGGWERLEYGQDSGAAASSSVSSVSPAMMASEAASSASRELGDGAVYENGTIRFLYPATWHALETDPSHRFGFVFSLMSPETISRKEAVEKEYAEMTAAGQDWPPDKPITVLPDVAVLFNENVNWGIQAFNGSDRTFASLEEFVADVRSGGIESLKVIRELPFDRTTAYVFEDSSYMTTHFMLVEHNGLYRIFLHDAAALDDPALRQIFSSFRFLS